MYKFGAGERYLTQDRRDADLIQDHKDGMAIHEIADKYNLSPDKVEKIIRQQS